MELVSRCRYLLLFILMSSLIWSLTGQVSHGQSGSDFNSSQIYIPLLGNADTQTPAQNDIEALNPHTHDDSYWADLAKDYPPFIVEEHMVQAASANNVGGEWGSLITWPHVPVSAAHLPDGRILTWASNERTSFPGSRPEQTYTAVWDPNTAQFQELFHNSHDMFCAHQGMLEDGRVFVNGGRNFGDSPFTSVFDYRTNTWTKLEEMNKGRWYPTSVIMPGDRVWTGLGTGGDQYPELWEPGEAWTLQTGTNFSGPVLNYINHYENNWWPYTSLAPDGRIFHAGPTPRMHWINPLGNGTIQQTGPEITNWYPKHAGVALYEEAKILIAGGATSGTIISSTNQSMLIDISSGTPQVTTIAPMQYDRKFHNAVTLPNGEVLVIGGNTSGIKFSDAGTVLTPEIWNPQTGTWRSMNNMASPRNYHSTAILLKDGRILSAGGGLCGCAADHTDGQVFSPPYLFDSNGSLAPRPSITSAPATASVGEQISLQATANLQRFTLIKISSTTHAVDTDQRFLEPAFTESAAGQYQLTFHPNINVMTPGFWMIFGLNNLGVPSEAAIVQITTDIDISQVGAIGHNGGSAFDLKCTAGEALVGITGQADTSIEQIGPLCVAIDNDGNWSGSPTNPGVTGGTSSTPFTRTCPTDYAVSGFSGRADTAVEQITLSCQSITTDGNASGAAQNLASIGGSGGNAIPLNSCSYELPATGIFGRSGTTIDAFGLHCEQLPIGNAPPNVSNPGDQISIIGNAINLGVSASDPEGSPLTYTATGLPTGLTIDSVNGIITGTLPPGSNNDYFVTLMVSDGEDTSNVFFTWTVYLDGLGSGQILREWWEGITGSSVWNLTSNPDFPVNPTGTSYLPKFEAPSSWGDNYGNRVRGYVHPPVTGQYQFWIASDNRSELWLSTDDVTTNKVLIASVPSYTSAQQWTKYPEQTAVITLTAGLKYYIEALHKEGNQGDHLAVAWQIPGDSLQVVSGQYLSPYQVANVALGQLASQSSTWVGAYNFEPGNAVDGNTDGDQAGNSLTHTNADNQAWWEVDLGAFYNLDFIRIWNRSDCCAEILSDFHVLVTDGPFVSQNLATTQAQPGVSDFHFPGTASQTTNIVLDRTGRYVRIQLSGLGPLHLAEVQIFASGLSSVNHPPTLAPIADQTHVQGDQALLTVSATDIDDDPLIYDAAGLPDGLAIDQVSGEISGTVTVPGTFNVIISVGDGKNGTDSASITWTVDPAPPIVIAAINAMPQPIDSPVNFTANASGGNNLRYRWLFGDDTPETAESTSPNISHTYSTPGRYIVQVTVVDDAEQMESHQFYQAIHEVHTVNRPTHSSTILYEEQSGNDRVWNVNPDNNSVSVFDTVTDQKLAEIVVDDEPYSVALAPDGRIWVANHESATLSIINASTLAVVQTVTLPHHSAPFGLAFSPTGDAAYVVLEETGQLLKLNPSSGAQLGIASVGSNPRHLSVLADGSKVLVSSFITPQLPGEDGANPQVEVNGASYGGEVTVINTQFMAASHLIVLQHSNRLDAEHTGRGIPNYLGPAVISPGELSAWVPSKQDNILSGMLREGIPLDFDHSVRSVTSRIDLLLSISDEADVTGNTDELGSRVDHDNAGVAGAAVFGFYGNYLFVALESNREVAVIDAYAANSELFRFDVERAPQGLALSADGSMLYVHNFMDRSVTVHDVSSLIDGGNLNVNLVTTYQTVATETLAPDVLQGKQLFYDALDSRLSLDSYMSCASCHNDGGHDGRTWDFTSFGEGLRNTISLEGHAGVGQGRLHWSANFDEVHDFENQIRSFAGGTGLMSDLAFNTGTRSDPLGDPKAGISSDLDALAAYVSSLTSFGESPYRNSNGSLTTDGVAGKAIFESETCAACHVGTGFTDSNQNLLHDIGTLKPSSGNRAGGPLLGIDTPTLRGLWATAPYLHDGSAATLGDAVLAHSGVSLTTNELDQLVAYLNQIDDSEPEPFVNGAPTITPLADQNNVEGDSVNLTINATDPNGHPLTYSATGLPTGLSIGTSSGIISGTASMAGTFNVNASVNDGNGGTDSIAFVWTVTVPANNPPSITNPGNQVNTVNDTVSLTISASDPDNDPLTFSATGLPNGLSINNSTGEIGTVVSAVGTFAVEITVDDGNGGSDSVTFTWTVDPPPNSSPVVTNPGDQTDTEGDAISLIIDATDPENDPITFGATGLPSGLTIEPTTGEISGTVTTAGLYSVMVAVSDNNGGTTDISFNWTIETPPATGSIIEIYARGSAGGENVDLKVDGLMVDSWTMATQPQVVSYTHASFITADLVRVEYNNNGRHPVTNADMNLIVDKITVDGAAYETEASTVLGYGVWTGSDCQTVDYHQNQLLACNGYFHYASAAANQAPTIGNPGSQTNSISDSINLNLVASDPDGDFLTYSAVGLPNGLTLISNTGTISGTVTTEGVWNAVVSVDDSNGGTDSTSFTWSVGDSPSGCGGLIQEAEEAQLAGNFVIGNSSSASSGQYIHVPNGAGNQWNGPGPDRADFCFNVTTPGFYRLLGTVLATNGGSNSFYVTINGSPTDGYIWDTTIDSVNYVDDYVNQRGGADPVEFNLTAGEHVVTVYAREDGTVLDKLALELISEPPGDITCDGLEREAEGGLLSGNFLIGSDANASNGKYIHLPNGSGNNLNGATGSDWAEYCFTVINPGTYLLEGTVLATNGGRNSFYLTVNGQPIAGYLWDTAIDANNYVQDYVSDRSGADPIQLTLNAGTHTVVVYPREDGTVLDKLVLVDAGNVNQSSLREQTPIHTSSGLYGTVHVPTHVENEPLLAGLQVTIIDAASGKTVGNTLTGRTGKFHFDLLPVGTYFVQLKFMLADGSRTSLMRRVEVNSMQMTEVSFDYLSSALRRTGKSKSSIFIPMIQ